MKRVTRRYLGPVGAVIFDWTGTTVDEGGRASVEALIEVFARRGVEVSDEQVRESKSSSRREHIRELCAMPVVASAWRIENGAEPTEADVDGMYAEATPRLLERIRAHAEPIAGVTDVVTALHERGIAIGSTTGYNRETLEVLHAAAKANGYDPDVAVSVSDVPEGRPAPYMCWTAAMKLGVWPAEACVKVGDTIDDVEAGLNAGMWTIGVAATGHGIGMSADALLKHPNRHALLGRARMRLKASGAHYVVDSVADLLPRINDIERRLAKGEKP